MYMFYFILCRILNGYSTLQLMFFSGCFISELKSPGGPKITETLGKFISLSY